MVGGFPEYLPLKKFIFNEGLRIVGEASQR